MKTCHALVTETHARRRETHESDPPSAPRALRDRSPAEPFSPHRCCSRTAALTPTTWQWWRKEVENAKLHSDTVVSSRQHCDTVQLSNARGGCPMGSMGYLAGPMGFHSLSNVPHPPVPIVQCPPSGGVLGTAGHGGYGQRPLGRRPIGSRWVDFASVINQDLKI